jgi:hypothetical protein
VRRDGEQCRKRPFGITGRTRLQLREPIRRAPLTRGRPQIEKGAAADSTLRRGASAQMRLARTCKTPLGAVKFASLGRWDSSPLCAAPLPEPMH